MIFALWDYLKYRGRAGRFSVGSPDSVVGAAFQERIPQAAIALLSPGDPIFVSSYGSFSSWVIMYLTRSEISHVVTYAGEDKVLHAVPSEGVVEEDLSSIEGPSSRLLPCHLDLSDIQRTKYRDVLRSHLGLGYSVRA